VSRVVERVLATELDWIRIGTSLGMSIRSAVPGGFDVFGLLDIDDGARPTEDALLNALETSEGEPLVAGWILRNSLVTETGDEHLLYANWRYRLRRVTRSDLTGRPSTGVNGFPDLLFPSDHRWIVSTLWDDSWRSIGLSTDRALEVERALPTFERIHPDADISTTGRDVR